MSWAAVIVLYRSRAELARLLPTLQAPQLVVVDVGPDDGGAQLARDHGATVIERRDNPGYGAANNIGITRVTQPVTVLLNPDTIDHAGVLPALADRATRPGLHAPRLLNEDGSVQRSAHPVPGTLGAFLPAALPWLPRPLRDRAEPYTADTPRTVGWAIAACLAAPTHLIHFDERIHLFAEDMELCLRARNEGLRTYLHTDLALTHTGGHSIDTEPFAQLAHNRRTVVERTRGTTAARLDDAAQILTFALRTYKGRRERNQLAAALKLRNC
ncbi:glycosyltransferase family 2 protein [Solirubrobacter phytolaccae]|uniref:Glycosyltransferase family 2 protein n=1 Tax=Solirubrobacter phytolaccae TaxID=1404360 RepID=A0A9X3NJR9_9ACTN|nr:glycosyltransferase family 2 protein [Solirubrobacter phytolaccae]MDA0182652.1 glycosyltransferase family 2 protein [Solirubrobacter phytolaccae]